MGKSKLFLITVGVSVALCCIIPSFVAAAPVAGEQQDTTAIPELQIKIGNFGNPADFGSPRPYACSQGNTGSCIQIDWIGKYISAVYQYAIGIAGVLAVVMIMAGGFLWLTSAGSPDRVGKAKDFISSALLGLFLALFSYIMLNTLNPRLVNLEPVVVQKVELTEAPVYAGYELAPGYGCCLVQGASTLWCQSTSESGCNNFAQSLGRTGDFRADELCHTIDECLAANAEIRCIDSAGSWNQYQLMPCSQDGYCWRSECVENTCNDISGGRHTLSLSSSACSDWCDTQIDRGTLPLAPDTSYEFGSFENGCCICETESILPGT